MMKKLVLLSLSVLVSLPLSIFAVETSYTYRQTVEVVETAGVQRFSYPVSLNLPAKNISSNLNDIRIYDEKGNQQLYEIADHSDSVVTVRFPADLAPNQKKTFYAYYGNKSAEKPKTFFGGVQQYTGMKFVAYAWGTVKISSYSKNNTITITDNSNRMIRDADNNKVAQEIYGAGTVRTFTLASPTMLKISCTGLASVAVGNFNAEETDSDALISGNILLYVPKFLAITSFHGNNKVQVWNRGEIAEEKILNAGESLVFDGIPSGFRRIVATNECLIQYGTASAYSLFAVPGRGNNYRFLPLGPVSITGSEGTEVDIIYPDGKPTDKYTLSQNQVVSLETQSYLKNIGTDKIVKALQIISSKPISVIGTGGAGGHGATFLFGDDGFAASQSWNTMTGDIDKENPAPRNIRIIAPFSNSVIDDGFGNGSLFPTLLPGGLAVSLKEFSVQYSLINLKMKREKCMLLDGNPDDSATFFQVPVLSDQSIKVSVPKTEQTDGGWVPGATTKTEGKPVEEKGDDNSSESWISKIFSSIDPRNNPLAFALTLIGLALVFILLASVFVTRKKARQIESEDISQEQRTEFTSSERPDLSETEPRQYLDPDRIPVEPELENQQHPNKTDWFDRILDDKSNTNSNGLTFKAPRLRAPKISQLMSDSKPGGYASSERHQKNQPTEQPPKQPVVEDTAELTVNTEPEQPKQSENQTQPAQEQQATLMPKPAHVEQESKPEPEIEKIIIPDSKCNPVAKNLAYKLCNEGVVADPGAIMRLYKEGMLDMFSRITISQSAAAILPAHIANMPIFEKIQLTPRESDKAIKLVQDLGIFEEVAKAIIVAEKTNILNYLTSAKLPERLRKLKITSIDSFC